VPRLLIRADGAARGNPGPAASGAVLIDLSRPDAHDPDCPPVAVIARPLGTQTNNYAEYTGVILALEKAQALGAREVELILDSQLIVEQLSGRWKVKHPGIAPLAARARALLAGFERWSISHERRASNRAADALANLALDDPAAAAAAEAGAAAEPDAAAEPQDPGPGPLGSVHMGAACVILDSRGRVLLVRHTYGRREWSLPGGLVQPNESPLAAAERELREETSLTGTAGSLTGAYFEENHDFGPLLHLVFRCPLPDGGEPVGQPPEIDRVGWFDLDQLPTPISDFTERRIHDAVSGGSAAFGVIESRKWR
jgi:ribonuclease HI/8-oxo-dGTP pyrophosphatase MutT (NUDIX family)